MEIRLHSGDYGTWRNRGGTGLLCARGLNNAIDLKDRDKIKWLHVMFTKTNTGDHDYFTLYKGLHGRGYIAETGVQLLWGAYQALGRAHNAGFRFLHFEVTYE